jgi:hypothetical protein
MPLLLDVRVRTISYFGMLLPLVLLSLLGRGMAAFASPMGAGLLAVLLIAAGAMVEDRGGVARIRAGAALRALAPLVLLAGCVAAATGSRHAGLARAPVWSFAAVAAMLAHIGYCGWRDVAVARDPRHGQRVRFEGFDDTTLRMRVRSGDVVIPLDAVRGAERVRLQRGFVVLLRLASRERIGGDAAALPWAARDPLTLVLDEHQLGLDAEVFAREALDRAERAGRYR